MEVSTYPATNRSAYAWIQISAPAAVLKCNATVKPLPGTALLDATSHTQAVCTIFQHCFRSQCDVDLAEKLESRTESQPVFKFARLHKSSKRSKMVMTLAPDF